MIRLLLLILSGFIIYSIVSGLLNSIKSQRPKSQSKEGEPMVEDPQCGTYLPVSDAIKATFNGQQHYFCSKKCVKEYKKSQEK